MNCIMQSIAPKTVKYTIILNNSSPALLLWIVLCKVQIQNNETNTQILFFLVSLEIVLDISAQSHSQDSSNNNNNNTSIYYHIKCVDTFFWTIVYSDLQILQLHLSHHICYHNWIKQS